MPLITWISKPEEFNSAVMAKLYWESDRSQILFPPKPWEELEEAYRQECIDRMQYVLDGLWSMGVIG